jgi:capsid assembly protease
MIPFHVLERAYNTPLLITPEKWCAIASVLSRGTVDFTILQTSLDENLLIKAAVPTSRPSGASRVGVAVIPIVGSLVARAAGFSGDSGLRSYQSIKRDLTSAMENPEVGGILLDVDSHGGEAGGCFAVADFIRQQISGVKPVWAHINESSYSAGYAIASAADRVLLTPTAGGGSIGVFLVHTDKSGKFEKDGVAHEYIFSGAKKIDGNPNGPLEKRVREELQAKVDALRGIFAAKVDSFRGMKEGSAMATESGVYMGEELVKVGLADGIASYDETLEELSAKINGQRRKSPMTTKQRMAALIAANEDSAEALAELNLHTQEQVEAIVAERLEGEMAAMQTTIDEVKAEVDAKVGAAVDGVKQVLAACHAAGVPELAKMLLDDGVLTIESASPLILAEKAAIDGKTKIESNVGAEVKKGADFVDFMRQKHSPKA